jgi:uncharacterized protein (DUF1778 family)
MASAVASETINIRVPAATKSLIDRAAEELHESRSSFMLEASLSRAESVLADRTRFVLTSEQMRRFNAALEKPLPNPKALSKLLKRRAPWAK